jgi:hypothetical protein
MPKVAVCATMRVSNGHPDAESSGTVIKSSSSQPVCYFKSLQPQSVSIQVQVMQQPRRVSSDEDTRTTEQGPWASDSASDMFGLGSLHACMQDLIAIIHVVSCD